MIHEFYVVIFLIQLLSNQKKQQFIKLNLFLKFRNFFSLKDVFLLLFCFVFKIC